MQSDTFQVGDHVTYGCGSFSYDILAIDSGKAQLGAHWLDLSELREPETYSRPSSSLSIPTSGSKTGPILKSKALRGDRSRAVAAEVA